MVGEGRDTSESLKERSEETVPRINGVSAHVQGRDHMHSLQSCRVQVDEFVVKFSYA